MLIPKYLNPDLEMWNGRAWSGICIANLFTGKHELFDKLSL